MSDEKCRERVVARVVEISLLLLVMRSKKRYHPLHVATVDMDGVSLPKP